MTSSLVGSEMCIRDRFKGRVVLQGNNNVQDENWDVAMFRELSSFPPTIACLLYTSDAADDM
eukprot:10271420-Prorocentrum_lima.AAC.1